MSDHMRHEFLDLNSYLDLINPIMRPEEVRSGDPLKCTVLGSGNVNREMRLWSYCPFGFEIQFDGSSGLLPGTVHN